nr:MAG TPA: hypothetical protein [Caudoviricetes sp.]
MGSSKALLWKHSKGIEYLRQAKARPGFAEKGTARFRGEKQRQRVDKPSNGIAS